MVTAMPIVGGTLCGGYFPDSTSLRNGHCRSKDDVMTYEWDESSARKMRLIRLASVCLLTVSAISVLVALLLAASPEGTNLYRSFLGAGL